MSGRVKPRRRQSPQQLGAQAPDGAASRLGLKPTTLQGKLRKYGLAKRG